MVISRAALEGVDDGVHREGEQLAGDDHELVDGHDGATDAFGCRLRQVDGDRRGGGADGEAQDDAEGYMTQTLGAMVVPIAPMKNRKARKVMLWRRPIGPT